MKTLLIIVMLSLFCGSIFALTGFGVSGVFAITEDTLGGGTLPVELSSFTATVTAQNSVQLNWVTQSENNLTGYYVYRSNAAALSEAIKVSGLLQATNTSSQQSYTYLDSEVSIEGNYYYWLQSLEMDGNGNYHGPISVQVNLAGEDPETPAVPGETCLKEIYPNPFRAGSFANIGVSVKDGDSATFEVYNLSGQVVKSSVLAPGNHLLFWDGHDRNGLLCSSGIYFVKLRSESFSGTAKLTLIK
ncbi:MAG: T9SS type A sorting domain-containing protein [Candidatus Cloacimonetes bacterium]|nr:T9SS type A sorting domain-containing protein [Candidatus Cloacimonadota bacterium]